MEVNYTYYKEACAGHVMPFAFVDLDRFDRNAAAMADRANGRPIRVASKSVRCTALLDRVLRSHDAYRGIMAYSVREAVFLSQHGFDDVLVAYPVAHALDASNLHVELRRGKRITLMADCGEHVRRLDAYAREHDVYLPVCLDLDLSSRFPGLFFGVRRSPIHTPEQAVALCRRIAQSQNLRLDGLMGYEAQIAGVPDNVPKKRISNSIVRILKDRSIREIRARRKAAVEAIREAGFELRIVNGGGTGSVESTIQEDCVTEVTVGSGLYSSTLFDRYRSFRHEPAAVYAIEITRIPKPGIYTCHGGGYVASGVGEDKRPMPFLPEGAHLLLHEGAGEVQTPIRYTGPETLAIGDPVFMRYAKAGEMCERFNVLLAVQNGKVVDEFPTYRGEGLALL